jgi:dTDP-4-amino-4,6-dideoxygalactose transaminase
MQLKLRNKIAYMYINALKDFYIKNNLLRKPNFYCSDCPRKKSKCNLCFNSFYRLNLYINEKKLNNINIITELNKQNIKCMVGACPEIYREKLFKKNKAFPKSRLKNAKLLGKTSLMFPIDPKKHLQTYRREIIIIKNILKKYI